MTQRGVSRDSRRRSACTRWAERRRRFARGAPHSRASRQTQYRYEPTGEQSCEIRGYGTGLQQTTRKTTFTVLSKPDKLYPARGADASCGTLNATYATTFGYDAYGRSVRTTYPDASYELDTLDDAGRATTHRNRSGQSLTSSFDDSGRPLVRTTPEGTYTSVYDLSGLKLSEVYAPATGFTAKARTVTWVYDFAARLTSEGANDGVRSLTVGYGYDAAGLRTSIVWPDGWTATYGYDALGRPTSVANGATTLATYGWDRLSRRTTTGFGAGPAAHIDALYQPDGDLAKLTEAFNGLSVDLRYGYDGSRRQTARGSTSAAWLWRATAGATTSYGAANPTDQYPTVGAESQTWDTRGNLATWGTRSFTHDSENRLRSATVSGATTAYEYDPLGRRVEKLPNGATSTRYLHAGDEEIGEYDGSTGALIQRFVPGPATDERAAVVSAAGTATWLMSDRQGSVVATTTSTGALAQAYAFDPYGNEITGAPSTGNAWRYTGRRFDPETGLYYYRARHYAPAIGRFVETDPIGYEGGVNLYAYVGNDPLGAVDPSGLCSETGTRLQNRDGTCDGPEEGSGYSGLSTRRSLAQQKRDFEAERKANQPGRDRELATGAVAVIGAGAVGAAGVIAAEAVGVEELGAAAVRGGRSLVRGVRSLGRCCFAAGTLVQTDHGLIAIEAIKVGDLVRARDEASGRTASKPVLALVRPHDRRIYTLSVAVIDHGRRHAAAFATTDDHPWRTTQGRWVETRDLRPGMRLLRASGVPARVVGLKVTARVETTYNLEVADFHTYFVGRDGLWVHNACFGGFKSAQKWASQLLKRGWSPGQVDEATASGQKFPAPNNINPANGATRFVHPTTGQSVVIDNVTGEVIHVGGPGFRY